ncbi:SGNH/GDSL hydrolase family protein [Bacillus sp. SCS-151]|uniref:SGNH/GDSL hydrolase family protein n=1 Tax=Nanhaiella sioensis TaxID=3115293 RepID=UPI00397B4E28
MRIGLIGDSLTEGRPGVSFASILQTRYENAVIDIHGKPGETVVSLYNRLLKKPQSSKYDVSFLWIGVNDVYSKLLRVQAQPIAKNHQEFEVYFQKVLDLLIESSAKIVTVTPAIVGEQLDNDSNHEVRELCAIIHAISNQYPNVTYLNLHDNFEKKLNGKNSSDYISTSTIRILIDVLFYKNINRIDRLSEKRGLYYTLDGIHLNSVGATLVANQYEKMIDDIFDDKKKKSLNKSLYT